MSRQRRATTSPLRGRQRPFRLKGIAFFGITAVVLFGLFEMLNGGGDGPEITAKVPDTLPPLATATPKAEATPCPYCNQDAQTWQRMTSGPPPQLFGDAMALVEGSCGRLIFGQRESERLPPASLAKIVTALVIEDELQLSQRVTVTLNGWDLAAEDGSSIFGLEAGMNVSIEELLYGLMLPSGNDAALTLAQNAGGIDAFVAKMNRRVQRLGLQNTRLATPDGRDAAEQYTSALDIALLGRELMAQPALRTIAGTQTFPWDGRLSWNTNYLLYAYPGAIGVKTGYTEAALETIVGAAQRDGRELYVASLHSDFAYLDAKRLLDWGFANTTSPC